MEVEAVNIDIAPIFCRINRAYNIDLIKQSIIPTPATSVALMARRVARITGREAIGGSSSCVKRGVVPLIAPVMRHRPP